MSSTKTICELWKVLTEGKTFERVFQKVKIVSAGNGSCTAEMTVDEEHTNVDGTLHGGCIATLVDMITSMALITSKKSVVGLSTNIHISYLQAAPLGQQILIEAKSNKVGQSLAFLEISIKNKENGALIATGTHTTFVGKNPTLVFLSQDPEFEK